MRAKERFSAMAEGYGQALTLRRGDEEKEVRAFFQPVAEKSDGAVPTVLGVSPRGLYRYIGSAEESLDNVTELVWRGRVFVPVRRRSVAVGEQVFYRWAMFRERDEVAV